MTTPANVLATVHRAVEGRGLPAPWLLRVDDHSIMMSVATMHDVDLWVKHLGLPPAKDQGAWAGEYRSTASYSVDRIGWCGAQLVTIAAPIEVPV